MPKRKDIKRILVMASGPIVTARPVNSDYSGTQACKALKEEGFIVILVNSNPATIMTDPEFSDRTYIEPLTAGGHRANHRKGAARRAAANARRADQSEIWRSSSPRAACSTSMGSS